MTTSPPPALDAQPASAALARLRPAWLMAALLVVTGVAITTSMLRTSTTFDEIVMVAGGARGYETGDWQIAPEHPPFTQYMYGLLPHLAGIEYPDETDVPAEARAQMGYRYQYARQLFWNVGNDPERVAFLGRIPAMLCALGLVLLVFAWTRRLYGDIPALLAALLTATLPDVLGHGGVAYNDVPVALAFAAAVWAIDTAIRTASWQRAIVAGLLIGLALGVKNSAVALAPVALILLVWEAFARRRDRAWLRRIGVAALATIAALYVALVIVYRGDVTLAEYRYALGFAFGHVTSLPVPSYLNGQVSVGGWWYFFPLVFFYKTSAGLHVLLGIAIVALGARLRFAPAALLHTRLRAPFVAALVFGLLLLSSDLNIGFRYALPLLPLLCILTAAGITRAVAEGPRMLRNVVAIAIVWIPLHVGFSYPFFLSYLSEYGPGADSAHEVLADSSVDWGQGLLALRDWMQRNEVPSVYLGYFGSALPEGYGIRYAMMPGFFPLEPQPPLPEPPRWVAISATNLTPTYLSNDPYARFREAPPAFVVGRSIFLYPIGD